jgi:steroid delta-isomerase-like uncharacterized protein
MSAENKVLIRRWFEEVWNKGRAAAIDELLAGNAVLHGFGPQPATAAAFKQFHAAYRNAFPDVTIQIEEIVAEGDVVAARWRAKGTHRGDGLGMAASGKAAEFNGMGFARVEGGKIAEGWNLFDQLGMLQQLGIATVPAAI